MPCEPEEAATAGLPEAYRCWRASRLGRITDRLEEQLILELIGPSAGKRILDAACGDGVLAAALARGGAIVTGIDSDTRMLAAGRARVEQARLAAALIEGDIRALPFPDAAFDVVVAVTVLCFVPDAGRAVREMARVLKPGGRLVIGELGRWSAWAAQRRIKGWWGSKIWQSARFRSAGELKQLMRDASLDVGEGRGAIFYPPSAAAARLFTPCDAWLGQRTTIGAALVTVVGRKPMFDDNPATSHN
jgi:SAM-dependent methyltransferase